MDVATPASKEISYTSTGSDLNRQSCRRVPDARQQGRARAPRVAPGRLRARPAPGRDGVVRNPGGDGKLVDIGPATNRIGPNQVGRAVNARTKAVIPVHYGGLAADMPAILDIARRHVRLRPRGPDAWSAPR